MRKFMEHYLNALHVYCRLRDVGISRKSAKKIALAYENLIAFHLLYQ